MFTAYRRSGLLLVVVLVQACAALAPLEDRREPPIVGPTAVIADSERPVSRLSATFFVLEQVDGVAAKWDSARATVQASAGQGRDMTLVHYERRVAAGRRQVKLSGIHQYSAPIQTMLGSKYAGPVEGVVNVELREGVRYRVNGALDAFRAEVWIEEEATGAVLGQKIVYGSDNPDWIKLAATSSYTCCNLHYYDDWISDGNWTSLPMIPAGARIVVTRIGSDRAHVLIEGRKLRIGLEYGNQRQTIGEFVAKIAVRDDPRTLMASYPQSIQKAIAAGKISVGMTKQQAILSLGYPPLDETPSTDASHWSYGADEDHRFTVVWDADGRVQQIVGAPSVENQVRYSE